MRPAALALAALVLVAAGVAHAAPTTSVAIDHSVRVAVGGEAASILVGNAAIAEVAVVDRRNLVITGKSFGSTNLIVLDINGRTLLERELLVAPRHDGDRVTVSRGAAVTTYSCADGCQQIGPSPNSTAAPADSAPAPVSTAATP